jgi:hypothetical protein
MARRPIVPLTGLFIILVFVDSVVAYRVFNSGWPSTISLAPTPDGAEQVQVHPIPLTSATWFFLAFAIAIHVLLLYFIWKAWKSSSSPTA